MRVADYIAATITKETDVIFAYQGGNISILYDAMAKCGINIIETRNEQGAAFAANAYAEKYNRLGVAISSSGPGAINMINGIANAYYDSIACLFITGSVSERSDYDDNVRQKTFQATDIISMVRGVTKYAVHISDVIDLPKVLIHAIKIAKSGRMGPVLIDLPHNLQKMESALISCAWEEKSDRKINQRACLVPDIQKNLFKMIDGLKTAQRPIFLIGGGCWAAQKSINELLSICRLPVISSLKGRGIINDTRFYYGFIGEYGNPEANVALYLADYIIAIGIQLTDRQMPNYELRKQLTRNIYCIDVDAYELSKNHMVKEKFCLDANDFCQYMLEKIHVIFTCKKWHNFITETGKYLDEAINNTSDYMLINTIFDSIKDSDEICLDVGIHQMCVAQSNKRKKYKYFFSGGLGCMGYALPAAIGIASGNQFHRVICFIGDGGFQMNIQELETIVYHRWNVKIFVYNNQSLGMIKELQKCMLNNTFEGSVKGYSCPDIKKIANAYGLGYACIKNYIINAGVNMVLNDYGPGVIEIRCNNDIQLKYNFKRIKDYILKLVKERRK